MTRDFVAVAGLLLLAGLVGVVARDNGAAGRALVLHWVAIEDARGTERGGLIAFSRDECPEPLGWERVTTSEGEPLFLAVGLLTDAQRSPVHPATGKPYSAYEILPACRRK